MLNIYRASAGSGKTFQLTLDYIKSLFKIDVSNPHRRVLAVTFTNKATDEMKTRILKELYALSTGDKSDFREKLVEETSLPESKINDKAKKLLIAILHDYSYFSISTIDRFFQQVIRSFAREIGVNGSYNLELDKSLILQQATDNLFLNLSDENKQLVDWLTDYAENKIEKGKSWNIKKDIAKLGDEIFEENYQYKVDQVREKILNKDFLKSYRTTLTAIVDDFATDCKTIARRALDIFQRYDLTHADFMRGGTAVLDRLLEQPEDELKSTFRKMSEDVSYCYAKSKPAHIKNAIENAYDDGLRDCIVALIEMYDTRYKDLVTATIILKNLGLLGILSDLSVQLKLLMEEQNMLLMSDTNMLLNKIIDNSDTPFVYEKTGLFVDNFMIDEFQDTSVLQWKNFYPLINNSLASGNSNLIVGDVKQSIYRWRNSDWKLLDNDVFEQFDKRQLQQIDLDTNWRSDKNIIDFNNTLFSLAPVVLQDLLNENIGDDTEMQKLFGSRITHAYENAKQNYSPRAGEGYVRIEFLPQQDGDDKNWTKQSLEKLPLILEDLQRQGFGPNEIAILVRRRSEAQMVVQKLLQYKNSTDAKADCCYDIMGNEGLLVDSSPSVRFLISILRLFVNPENQIEKIIANYNYSVAKELTTREEALTYSFGELGDEKLLTRFSEKELEKLKNIQHLPLFEMVEQLIILFKVDSWNDDAVFVQAFQDAVYQFAAGKIAGLNDFLEWWDENSGKKFVSVPENQHALRVMTIHTSKGLDFGAVVMPFADWKLEKSGDILWCKTDKEPYNEMPLLPVEYGSKLSNSHFANEYLDEKMHQYIDNLNVVYVAFTRAKHQLICMTPKVERKAKDAKTNSVSEMLMDCFNSAQMSSFFNSETDVFECGTQVAHQSKTIEQNSEKAVGYPSVERGERLKISSKSKDFWLFDQKLSDSKLNYGLIMHDVLRQISEPEDQTQVLDLMVTSGRINEDERIKIDAELAKFWELPQIDNWFPRGGTVLNERAILMPNGENYRPDRIVINGSEATIIDYKFGDKESDSHIKQVQNYMRLVTEIGYNTSGFVCYVALGKVTPVSI